jgi:predicted transcriptional regulator YdeE
MAKKKKKTVAKKRVARKPVSKTNAAPKKGAKKAPKAKPRTKKLAAKVASKKKPRVSKRPKKGSLRLAIRSIEALRLAAIVSTASPIDFAGSWQQAMPLAKARAMSGEFLAAFTLKETGISWYAAALSVADDVSIDAPMQEVIAPAGKYVVFTYVGGYEGIGAAWGAFMNRAKAEGHKADPDRLYLEIYKDDGSKSPSQIPSTDLCIPV